MQRCHYCGQLNDDFEESCVYCGEKLFTRVDRDSNEVTYEDGDDDFNHMYAIKVAQELIDQDNKPKKRSRRKVQSIDDLDDFAKELLSPETMKDDSTKINESLFKNNPLYADEDEEVFIKDDDLTQENEIINTPRQENEVIDTPTQENEVIVDSHLNEEDYDVDEDVIIIEDEDVNYNVKEVEKKEEVKPKTEKVKPVVKVKPKTKKVKPKLEEVKPFTTEDTTLIEDNLKKKLKRNRKLETRIGLSFKDIDLVVDGVSKQLTITGRVSINQLLGGKFLKLSIVCFNSSGETIDTANTTLQMNIIKKYYEFFIESFPDLDSIERIIILPEVTDQNPTVKSKKPAENKNQKKVKAQEKPKNRKKDKKKTSAKRTRKSNKKNLIENKPTKKESAQNSIFIEHMKEIERKIGLDITNASVLIKTSDKLVIVGEIHIKNPDKYSSINITATCYDDNNNIVATESSQINTRLFLGFDTLNIEIRDVNVRTIKRIRLYPTFQ